MNLDLHTGALDLALQPSHLLILAPAVAAALIIGLVRRGGPLTAGLAMGWHFVAVLAAAALVFQSMRGGLRADIDTVGSLPLGPTMSVPMRLHVDRIGILVGAAVALVSLTVQAFGRWYLYYDPRYRQFAATVGIFTAAMQLVVLSGDVLVTLIGWELMGWCSYLLIGHDSERPKARRAAYKAFLVTRLADAPFVVGLAALAIGARTTDLRAIVAHWSTRPGVALTAALVCVICGVAGKSAQVPFQDWLPDAMEGPTPASALIHAATMVAAGTVVLARLAPLLQISGKARFTLAVVAGLSVVVAALLAFLQHDLKRLLAWSTVSQVGLMLLGLSVLRRGVTADAAVLHLMSHAAFKALLFLMIGWLTVVVGSTLVERMSGALVHHREARVLIGVGLLALAAVPPTMGFVSKDLIIDESLRSATEHNRPAAVAATAALIVVPLTAAYAMRAWLILTHQTVSERHFALDVIDDSHQVEEVDLLDMLIGAEPVDSRGRTVSGAAAADESAETTETVPRPPAGTRGLLSLLGTVSFFGGLLVVSPWLAVDYQHPLLLITGAVLLAMAAAAVLVRAMSIGTVYGDAAERLPRSLRSWASRGGDADRLYVLLVGRPVEALARLVHRGDGAGATGVSRLAALASWCGERLDRAHRRTPTSGLLGVSAGVIIVGLLGVLWL